MIRHAIRASSLFIIEIFLHLLKSYLFMGQKYVAPFCIHNVGVIKKKVSFFGQKMLFLEIL